MDQTIMQSWEFMELSLSFLIPSVSHKRKLQNLSTIPFSEGKKKKKDLSGALKYFARTVTNFL